MPKPRQHPIFQTVWWGTNVFLALALVAVAYTGYREFAIRWYLDGFSDAIVPGIMPTEPKVQAILDWMRVEPLRAPGSPDGLSTRDPQVTLNYQKLLQVCGTATNAFLNLAREDDLRVRRLLLLAPDGSAKHVVAEVLIDGRWIVVDPTYRVIMRDAKGRMLTRTDLQRPDLLAQATSAIQNYPSEYTYQHVAHVRMARLPVVGRFLRRFFDTIYPNWEEAVDWSLLLERESFFYLMLASTVFLFLLAFRQILGWYADSMLRISRFHFREKLIRAGVAFLSTPEIKE
ncbi:MAG TPA: transglutaminase domain-containing protein [Candidatus Acidoferrum sp.]